MSMSSLPLTKLRYYFLSPLHNSIRRQHQIKKHIVVITRQQRKKSSLSYDRTTGIITNNNNDPISRTLIGLEIHAQLTSTPRKLFSPSTITKSAIPNTNICHFDIAYPGVLPQLSGEAVHAAILTACALNSTINPTSRFERKHYVYPDLPHGYQITQQRWPIATNGMLHVNENIIVPLERIQLEVDSGKTIVADEENGPLSLDYNRAGVPLLELVFHPTLHSSYEVAESIQFLRRLLRRLNVCDGKMEEGSLRVDVNVSIIPSPFKEDSNTNTGRVEIKNLNSIRQVTMAIEYEGLRQTELFLSSSSSAPFKIKKETRTFDPIKKRTIVLRSKEDDVDYRFMPEPNIPPLKLNRKTLNGKTLQQVIDDYQTVLNNANEHKLIENLTSSENYNLSKEVSTQLATSDFTFATSLFYEIMIILLKEIDDNGGDSSSTINLKPHVVASMVANWICNDYFALLKKLQQHQQQMISSSSDNDNMSYVDSNRFAMLLLLVWNKEITIHSGKKILSIMHNDIIENNNTTTASEKYPSEIAVELGLLLTSPSSSSIDDNDVRKNLNQTIKDIVCNDQYEKQRLQFQKGGRHINKIHKFFFGKVMQKTKGIYEPDLIHDVLKNVLEEI